MDYSPPRSSVHGIFWDWTWSLCLSHWQADSLPLLPPGQPHIYSVIFLLVLSITIKESGNGEAITWTRPKKSLNWHNISKPVPFNLEASALNIFLTKLEYNNFKNLKKKTLILQLVPCKHLIFKWCIRSPIKVYFMCLLATYVKKKSSYLISNVKICKNYWQSLF